MKFPAYHDKNPGDIVENCVKPDKVEDSGEHEEYNLKDNVGIKD